jgi:hypothetical protein
MRTARLHAHCVSPPRRPPAPRPFLSQVPPEWFCPLSRVLMLDPVCLMDGLSYNRAALEEWLESKGSINPATGAPLDLPVPCTPSLVAACTLHACIHAACIYAAHACTCHATPTHPNPNLTLTRCCASPTCCCTGRSTRCSRPTRSCSSSPRRRAPRGAAGAAAVAGAAGAARGACLQPERRAGRVCCSPAWGVHGACTVSAHLVVLICLESLRWLTILRA